MLDVGCGSGLSGQALEEAGHYWVGCDISMSMLVGKLAGFTTYACTFNHISHVYIFSSEQQVAKERDAETGDLIHSDMGQGLLLATSSVVVTSAHHLLL